METYYAHITEDGRKQSVDDHLHGCAELSAAFASAFGAEQYGYLAGIMHDIGKYSEGFQNRLFGGPKVDHSSAGALECALKGQLPVGICIAGHHGGLPDYGNERVDSEDDATFIGRLKRAFPKRSTAYPGWRGVVPDLQPFELHDSDDYSYAAWIRMLYSCLVDADFLDTEAFMTNGAADRGNYDSLSVLGNRIERFTKKWDTATNDLNVIRNGIRHDCERAAAQDPGLFSLTVPTGGGKTVSSMTFALRHAIANGMDRIIYVIPYTSIIEQNAEVFRSILGEKNVVEHHCEAQSFYGEELTEVQKRAALASENWDAPVIVTTAVQFFESLYANKPSKCRKLHNIANSVIIFDEVQSTPTEHLLPCMAIIGTLVRYFNASAVLCSATQPFVADLLETYAPLNPVREICSDVAGLFEKLERVKYVYSGTMTAETLANELSEKKQVLCIVNKRKTAKELWSDLPEEGSFHLSTLMTPADRKRTLDIIRKRLRDGLSCRVVSTSLIEAGVDVDFPFVYREIAGLDSIVQAAGRCNREGKRSADASIVTVFELDERPPVMLRINVGAAREAISATGEIGSREAVDWYFRSYRSFIGRENIDVTDTVKHLRDGISGSRLPFKTVAERFHLIDQNTATVYIPTNENAEMIKRIRNGSADRNVYRAMGKFSVSVYEDHYRELYEAGCVDEVAPDMAILTDSALYNDKTGLSLLVNGGRAEFV